MKEDIKDIDSPLKRVIQLHGVTYKYKDDKEQDKTKLTPRMGLIAQEVEKVVPEVVKQMNDGSEAIAYTDLIGLLVEAIKEQQVEIQGLRSHIDSVELNCCGNSLKSATVTTGSSSLLAGNIAKLDQNIPNPFNRETKINCVVPDQSGSSDLYVFNMQGTQLQQHKISGKRNQTITISGSSLNPGMYLYTLVIDGKEIDTKRMILTK